MNLADVLRATAATHPDWPAVTDLGSGRTLTYAELGHESEERELDGHERAIERNGAKRPAHGTQDPSARRGHLRSRQTG